jgi:hypothetical protein
MAFEELRARLEQLLADRGRGAGARAYAEGLYRALVDAKVAIGDMKRGLSATARELAAEQQHLADSERRGRLAEEIGDQDTAELARLWAGKHRERVDLLVRKQRVQEDELVLAERQLAEWTEAYRRAKAGVPPGVGPAPPDAAPELDRAGLELDRKAKETLVKEQLAALKKKLGREGGAE